MDFGSYIALFGSAFASIVKVSKKKKNGGDKLMKVFLHASVVKQKLLGMINSLPALVLVCFFPPH